jgi:hypothetical protein
MINNSSNRSTPYSATAPYPAKPQSDAGQNSCGSNQPPPSAPAQTPSEHAATSLRLTAEINVGLEALRYRLFGDPREPKQESDTGALEPKNSDSLLDQAAHFDLCRALDQVNAIHSRF